MFALAKEIARQPDEVNRLSHSVHSVTLSLQRPIQLIGIGTSLHACRIAESWFCTLSSDSCDVRAVEAHYFALHHAIDSRTQLVVVSHRGTKRFTNEALRRAKEAGARTIVITADSEVTLDSDEVIRTCSPDAVSTHTVSYTSALVVLGQLVSNSLGSTGTTLLDDLQNVGKLIKQALETDIPAHIIDSVCKHDRLLIVGFGVDAITADEGALKLKEGTYKWAESLTTEFALHGPPASYDSSLCALVIQPNINDGGRTETIYHLLRELDADCWTIGKNGDIKVPNVGSSVKPFVDVIPLQRIVNQVAERVGSNPDMIRTDTEPWRSAMLGIQL